MRNPAVDAYIAKSAYFARPIFAQAVAWLAAGKPLHWKYQDC